MAERSKGPSFESSAAIAIASGRAVFCAWRAARQSVIADEAYAFNTYLSGSWHDLYLQHAASIHILYSLLAKLSIALFGISEIALRLPSVIAGIFMMLGVWKILEAAPGPVRWATYLAVALQPLFLDFSIVGRGYGLALTCLIWAVYFAMKERRIASGVLLGLAVSANFTAIFPAIGIGFALLLLEKTKRAALSVAIPAIAVASILCAPSLPGIREEIATVRQTHKPDGRLSLRESGYDLILRSIRAAPPQGLFGTELAAQLIEFTVVPVLALFTALTGLVAWRRGQRFLLLPALALAGDLVAAVIARYAFGLWYPIDRYGLHWIMLAMLAVALSAGFVTERIPRLVCVVVMAALAVQFGTQLKTQFFGSWRSDSAIREVALRLQKECEGRAPGSVSLSVSAMHREAVEYYRQRFHIAALQPVERAGRPPLSGRDFYVWNFPERRRPELSKLTILLRDPFTGVVLAKQ